MDYITYIKIGPLLYEVLSEEKPIIEEAIKEYVFCEKKEIVDFKRYEIIRCQAYHTTEAQPIAGNMVWSNPERVIFMDQEKEQRLFMQNGAIYGISSYVSENELSIMIQKDMIPVFRIDLLFLEYLYLEKFLLRKNAIVLHSAYIAWQEEGIVFTAPSGTGKSTQASLWEKYEGAKIINGDRSILIMDEEKERVEVCGLPFCGSSEINYDEQYPLKAIVSLEQGKENKIERLKLQEIIGKMYGESSINPWNYESVQQAIDVIQKIAMTVPAYHLSCDISKKAVEMLKKELKY